MFLSGVVKGYPAAKTKYVDKARGDGTYDVTEAFGGVKYGDRTLSFTFTAIGAWNRAKEAIINDIHGKKMKLTLDEDENYYYTGRCNVDENRSDRNLNIIAITAVCEPYKYKQQPTVHTEKVAGIKDIILTNDRREVIPVIECNSDMILTFDGNTYGLKKGRQKILDVRLVQGYNRVRISGNGTVTFFYQEGAL